MDTGSYMANQMDDLITAGLHQRDLFEEELHADMELYISEKCYTWSTDAIVKNYIEKYSKGFYVSHTCKDVIIKFQDRLKKLYQ